MVNKINSIVFRLSNVDLKTRSKTYLDTIPAYHLEASNKKDCNCSKTPNSNLLSISSIRCKC